MFVINSCKKLTFSILTANEMYFITKTQKKSIVEKTLMRSEVCLIVKNVVN